MEQIANVVITLGIPWKALQKESQSSDKSRVDLPTILSQRAYFVDFMEFAASKSCEEVSSFVQYVECAMMECSSVLSFSYCFCPIFPSKNI